MEKQGLIEREKKTETDGQMVDEQTSVLQTLKGLISKLLVALLTTCVQCVTCIGYMCPIVAENSS